MVTGAIAYEELRAHDPRVAAIVLDLMSQHPDRGPFELAAARASGENRDLRIFMEMARWSDDIRKGMYDHPTWHYASKPLVDAQHPPQADPQGAGAGSAIEAFALNLSVARDPRAPAPDRAVALCWIFHLVGDIHQPLHAADQYSAAYPRGDQGGGLQYVLDPQSGQPLSLHWYWDQAVNRASDAAPARAELLRKKFPRVDFPELAPQGGDANFAAWAAESYVLARTEVYRTDLITGASERQATALTAGYAHNAGAVAERRLTLSAYRLADVLVAALHEQP